MSMQILTSDSVLLGLLRIAGRLSLLEMADAMEVTQTAIRKRLVRLMGQNAIQREATRYGRGRPRHYYWLTEKGLCMTSSNFTDLTMTRWEKMLQKSDPTLRGATLQRMARKLAAVLRSAVD
jgi:DeoR family transcriptional regulator, suf operon transcriptional repressor